MGFTRQALGGASHTAHDDADDGDGDRYILCTSKNDVGNPPTPFATRSPETSLFFLPVKMTALQFNYNSYLS